MKKILVIALVLVGCDSKPVADQDRTVAFKQGESIYFTQKKNIRTTATGVCFISIDGDYYGRVCIEGSYTKIEY
jgi:hypothetical protein